MDMEKDMVLLISDHIRRYTIFHGYIRTISDKIFGNEVVEYVTGKRRYKRDIHFFLQYTNTIMQGTN
jgi:hypothetical protein